MVFCADDMWFSTSCFLACGMLRPQLNHVYVLVTRKGQGGSLSMCSSLFLPSFPSSLPNPLLSPSLPSSPSLTPSPSLPPSFPHRWADYLPADGTNPTSEHLFVHPFLQVLERSPGFSWSMCWGQHITSPGLKGVNTKSLIAACRIRSP